MVIDIPAHIIEDARRIDWHALTEAVQDYGPVFTVLHDTWDRETLSQIAEGHLFVRDEMMNDAIAQGLKEEGGITAVRLTSHGNGRLDISCETTKKYRHIDLSGTLENLVHTGEKSYAVYRVRKKNIPDHGFMSWLFSRISLSMVQRMAGYTDLSKQLPVTIRGNRVLVDFHAVLAESTLGQRVFRGHRLIDMIEIEGAEVQEGGIMFDTKLNVPDEVREALLEVLKEKSEGILHDRKEGGTS